MPEQKQKTYRELVQDIRDTLQRAYDQAGALRDTADGREKNIFNETRGAVNGLLRSWDTFDRLLPEDRASMVVGNWPKSIMH